MTRHMIILNFIIKVWLLAELNCLCIFYIFMEYRVYRQLCDIYVCLIRIYIFVYMQLPKYFSFVSWIAAATRLLVLYVCCNLYYVPVSLCSTYGLKTTIRLVQTSVVDQGAQWYIFNIMSFRFRMKPPLLLFEIQSLTFVYDCYGNIMLLCNLFKFF